MRYGRRRARFPWRRVLVTALAVVGGVTLVMAAVNWRSLRGLYRLNLVAPVVRQLEATVRLDPAALRTRRLTDAGATRQLQEGLADLGFPSRVSPQR
ncbi:MAG: hypothetical protein ACM3RP_10840 [Chitinophagales bacterium]